MALRPGSRSARFWAELVLIPLLESELDGCSHWDRARCAAEDGFSSVVGGVQGTLGGFLAGIGPKKAFSSRSGVDTDCQVLSTLRGVSHRILRAVEASQREGGDRSAGLGREGRIQGSGCFPCWRHEGSCERGAERSRRVRRGCLVVKLSMEPLEELVVGKSLFGAH